MTEGARTEPRREGGWLLLLDFDGTVTLRDADFEIADAVLPLARGRADEPFARERAYEPLARAYEQLEIGTAEYFAGYLALLGLDAEEVARHAVDVALRPGLDGLVSTARDLGMEVRIVSEGLDVYVRPALAAAGLDGIALSCNRARRDGAGWQVLAAPEAESCGRCLNCKGAHVRRAHEEGRRVAIVGNGASDLCGARAADLVVARDTLARHCLREGIPHQSWATFEDVAAALRAGVRPAA